MPAPSIKLSLVNPGGAGTPAPLDQVPIYCGTAESGDLEVIQTFGSLAAARAEYTRGHLVDVIAAAFARGASSVKACRLTGATAGTISAVTQTGSGGTVAITGTASMALDCKIEIMTSGDNGVATFRYTLDDFADSGVEPTWSETLLVPAGGTYTFPGTALVATFDDDPTPLAAGDTFEWTVHPAYYTATQVAAVTDAVQLPAAGDATFLVYCGESTSATTADTLAASIASQLSTLFSAAQFFGALYGASEDTPTNVVTAIDGTVSTPPFLAGLYGKAYAVNPSATPGRGIIALSAHEVAAMRIAASLISTDPARTASGPLAGVTGTNHDARLEGSALYDARVGCLTTYASRLSGGVFLQSVRLLDAPTGDFEYWPHAAVMIAALRAVHPVAWLQLSELYRQNANATMDARDRASLKSACDRALASALLQPLNVRGYPGHVSAASASVSATTELPAIDVEIAIRPLGYGKDIKFTLRYAGEV